MNFMGLIGSAMAGGAQAGLAHVADKEKQKRTLDLEQVKAQIEKDKLKYADELARSRAEWAVGVKVDETRRVGEAQTGVDIDRSTKLGPVEVANAKAVEQAKRDIVNQDTLQIGNDPTILAAKQRIAQAGAVESPESRARADIARLTLQERQQATKLIEEYENPDTTPERRQQIRDALTLRGVLKPSDKDTRSDYIEVEETSTDPETGKETKVKKKLPREEVARGEAATAVRLGRMTLDKANARLTNAGYATISMGGAAAGKGGKNDKTDKTDKTDGPTPGQSPLLTPQEKAAAEAATRQAQQKAEWDAIAKQRESEGLEQLRSEASSLTIADIRTLSPSRAYEILNKYGRVLTSEQQRALKKRL